MSVPTKGVVFGSAIHVNFELVPLMKGLTIASISSELVEARRLRFARFPRKNQVRRVVAQDEWVLSNDMETVDINGRDGYRFHRSIQVPTSLTSCLQTVNTRGVNVEHMIVSYFLLRNPDGHDLSV